MDADALRTRLAAELGFVVAERATLELDAARGRDGYAEHQARLTVQGAEVPALLLLPKRPGGGAVLVHHQHASRWHLGKSEVAGRVGDPWQAFGPALARAGVTVLAADAPGFEDRRVSGPGTDARDTDRSEYMHLFKYRLLVGQPLMRTVLAEATAAHTALSALPSVHPGRVGVLGHSMGGATCLFHAALNERVAFAAVSGAACTYRYRMRHGVGIEHAQVIPGVLDTGDFDDFAALVAPRPLLLCSATEDEYSGDATAIADAAARVYRDLGEPERLTHERSAGGHALTEQRFNLLVRWTVARAGTGSGGVSLE